ncbi:MAG: transcriptional regulator [Rhodobiaceae bacterium]|jgi:DNA-binding phage protein|nr:transcriptional regulator [Rhodobiaceae bacterium]MBT5518957.1 transcriptional regulator [Rhodobiaceae bacterium]MBT7642858.1 transcriptional regulator [Rhodobiaceae bacterium]MDG2495706.1 transcriptional regulator [Alphaproteobacteria bacterium]
MTRKYRLFDDTVKEHFATDAEFRVQLIIHTLNCFLEGDAKMGQQMLRKYIKTDLGYKQLEELTGISEKSLNRMFGANGNPTTRNLFKVIEAISKHERIKLNVSVAAE